MQQSADKPKKIAIQHDGMLTIATATSRKSTAWKNTDISYSDFLKKLSTTVRTKESLAEYMKLSKDEQGSIKDVGGFVGGSLKGGRRKADSVAWRQLITLDADFIQGDFWDGVTTFFDNACVIYSTHKHTSKKPRIRLIIPLLRPVSAEEYVAVAKKLADIFGIDYFDDTTYQPHRLMYWPSTASDGDYEFDYQDAQWLDPAEILKMYNDWRDPAEWPESSRQRESRKKMADKQGNPLEKPGMVGAFCRTYSITEAIEVFLSDVYSDAGDGRYTFNGGSTTGGLVLYDDVFAYSHHGTDPVSEQLVNAYDLVRLHLFNDLDEDAKEGTPVNRLPSAKAMNDKVRTLDKVKMMLADERIKSASEDFNIDVDTESDTEERSQDDGLWKAKFDINKAGELEVTAKNLKLILENDPHLKGCFAFNEFSRQPEVLRDLPWRKKEKGVGWSNGDDEDLRNYLDMVWSITGNSKIADAIGGVQRANTFHPVRDYLGTLEWDGVNRVDTLLIDFLGAADTEYVRTVTRMTLVAAVARISKPGCKYDYMLTLVGLQGLGKSMLFNMLGGKWFSDSLTSIHGKEAYESLHGVWIMEMGELAATKKSEVETIKQFLSKQVDRYRVAYGKRPEEFPRQCIFIGTTNEHEFLRDRTGNRRFLPVEVQPDSIRKWKELDSEKGRQEINQLWAEAVHLFKSGSPLYLDETMAAEALTMQIAHTVESTYAGQILSFLEKPITSDWYKKSINDRKLAMRENEFSDDFSEEEEELLEKNEALDTQKSNTRLREKVCALEIWCECLGKDRGSFPMHESREINSILATLPGWKPHKSTLKFGAEYGTQRAFIRVEK
ncbi:VapE domain-containing protein [Lysinibacillus sp. NPDC093688]|uniref:VapE domain-containing protein n=1 Tax=Lysinibacillus sp. NPDC093688 TaxID=3390577 RepID=UPI003D05572A